MGYIATLNIIFNPYEWNMFDFEKSKDIVEKQWWGNLVWIPVAMAVNLLTLPFNIIWIMLGLSFELLFLPIEFLLGNITIWSWFIIGPILSD